MFASAGDRLSGVQERLERAFAFHVIPLGRLERELDGLGFTEFSRSIPGRGFAYVAAQRVSTGHGRACGPHAAQERATGVGGPRTEGG